MLKRVLNRTPTAQGPGAGRDARSEIGGRILHPASCISHQCAAASVTREVGQGLLEFGIILPVAIVLLIGIIEFGRYYMVRQTITNAAREGARVAILPSTQWEYEVREVVTQYVSGAGLDPSHLYVDATGLRGATGTRTTVTVRYPYNSIMFRFLGRTGPISVQAVCTMVHE